MQIAKVRGTVVSTQCDPDIRGKLLLVQFLGAEGQLLPEYEVANDRVGAGYDEWVLVTRGSGARQRDDRQNHRPLDATIVGIVDTVSVDNQLLYSKKDQYR
jgi:carbon dioxide concentrating mechanism protein CcmL